MTYHLTSETERWKIEPLKFDQINRWKLFHAVGEAWKGLRGFPTAEAAMAAVAGGKTGVEIWDGTPHDDADFAPAKWSAESW
ncbi:MAG TPA: hypothetical protein VHE61_17960 [Opitutaceae bacterium]|nr:hypothetical protein [Opitutaceae bacterium]